MGTEEEATEMDEVLGADPEWKSHSHHQELCSPGRSPQWAPTTHGAEVGGQHSLQVIVMYFSSLLRKQLSLDTQEIREAVSVKDMLLLCNKTLFWFSGKSLFK